MMRLSRWAAAGLLGASVLLIPAAVAAKDYPHARGPLAGLGPLRGALVHLDNDVRQIFRRLGVVQQSQQQQSASLRQESQKVRALSLQMQTDSQQLASLEQTLRGQEAQIQSLDQTVSTLAQAIQGQNPPPPITHTVTVQEHDAAGHPIFVSLSLIPVNGSAPIEDNPQDSVPTSNRVVFTNLPDGTYRVVPAVPEYHIASPTTLTIGPTGPTAVNLHVSGDTYTIAGTAIANNQLLSHAPVTLTDTSGITWSDDWSTRANGFFVLRGIPDGTYTLTIGTSSPIKQQVTVNNGNVNLGYIGN